MDSWPYAIEFILLHSNSRDGGTKLNVIITAESIFDCATSIKHTMANTQMVDAATR